MKRSNINSWHTFNNAEAVAQYALEQIIIASAVAIKKHGEFRLVLAGGTTPKRIYQLLAQQQLPWQQWKLFLGDERCLAVNDDQRNSRMIQSQWLEKVAFPEHNFYVIAAEKGAEAAASDYAAIIKVFLPFDMVLLGMGEDGHTASLFPGHEHNQHELVHAVHNAPKPPPDRVSLSSGALGQTEQLLIMITGAGKRQAVTSWQQGESLPIAGISTPNGVTILIDKLAMPE